MRPPEALYRFLRNWEGRAGKPVLEAYLDGGGVATIGYGHTHGVQLGDTCTAEQAEDWLRAEVDEVWYDIDPAIHQTLAEHEMSAIVSLAYNIGVPAFLKSTLLRRLNGGDFGSAADEFLRWNKDNGRVVPGLTKRRKAERAIFLDADYGGAP